MQVREQRLAGTEQSVLFGERFLDLDHQVGGLEHRRVLRQEPRPGALVVRIRVSRLESGPALDHDGVPRLAS